MHHHKKLQGFKYGQFKHAQRKKPPKLVWLKSIFHWEQVLRWVKFASPRQKNSLKSTARRQAERKTADAKYIPLVLSRASFALLRLASRSGVRSKTRQTQFKLAAVERRQRGLVLLMMLEAGFFDLEEETTAPKKKKRSVWVKPFLLRRLDRTCDTTSPFNWISGGECQREKSSAYICETKIEQSLMVFLYIKNHLIRTSMK